MKTIVIVAVPNSPRIKLKHITFDSKKHTFVYDRLTIINTKKDLGQVQRVYTE